MLTSFRTSTESPKPLRLSRSGGESMFSDLADAARERAEECRREAVSAMGADDAIAWLSLADEWRKVAQATAIDYAAVAPTNGDALAQRASRCPA
jgi:hypothetical protein